MYTERISALPRGTALTRAAAALIQAKGSTYEAIRIAQGLTPAEWEQNYQHEKNGEPQKKIPPRKWLDTPHTVQYLKTAIAAGTTSDSVWGGPLAYADNFVASEFAALLRDGSIAGRLKGLRHVPLNCRCPRETASASVAWVGQGGAVPVSKMQLETNTLGIAKVGGICIVTAELAQFGTPAAERLMREDLIASSIEFLDQQFIDPSVTAIANVNPASITNGIAATQSTHASTVSTATEIATDLATIAGGMANNDETDALYWVTTRADAMRLAAKRGTDGNTAFRTVTAAGGTLLGIPVITSNAVPHSVSAGSIVVLVNAAGIDYGDLDAIEIDVSGQAALQMDSAPTGSSVTPTGTEVVSLFQTNSAAIKLAAFRNYRRVRDTAVSVLDNCHF